MRQVVVWILFAVSFTVTFSAAAFADEPWKLIQGGVSSEFFGKPFKVESVTVTREIVQDNKAYYSYKFIIRRPSLDDSWGRAQLGRLKYRLYYWAALAGTNPFDVTYHRGLEVYQDTHRNPRKIVVHLLQGLRPGRHTIQLAIFPYPMYSEYYSFKQMIQFYRGRYGTFLKSLGKALAVTNPYAAAAVFGGEVATSFVQDEFINASLIRLANRYGQLVELEVLAKMPKITTRYEDDTANLLRMRNLIPNPDFVKTIPTNDIRLDGRVARSQYVFGDRLSAGTKVAYKLYKYRGKPSDPHPPGISTGAKHKRERVSSDPHPPAICNPNDRSSAPVVWILSDPVPYTGRTPICRYEGQLWILGWQVKNITKGPKDQWNCYTKSNVAANRNYGGKLCPAK